MFKFLQLLFLMLTLCFYSFSSDTIKSENDSFLDSYLDAVVNNDISKYESLMFSKSDLEHIIKEYEVTYPNCITDNEMNYDIQPFIKQFKSTDFKSLNINSYKVIYSQPINGCGKMEGLKVLLALKNNDEPIQNRTLILFKYNNSYKLLFDLSPKAN